MNASRNELANTANNAGAFFAGLLLGGFLGAVTMLLVAPQSGEKTRSLIEREGRDLRDQVTETVEDVVLPARDKARKVMSNVRKQAQELEERGQEMVEDQKEIVTDAVDAEKEAVKKATKG